MVLSLDTIHLELTNVCNLKCVMCFRQESKKIGFMKLNLYKKIIDELVLLNSPPIVKLSWRGEPLLHPQVCEMVRYATGKGLTVKLLTNGTRIDEDFLQALPCLGLAEIGFSIDALDKKEYESIRLGASFEKTYHNIISAIGVAKSVDVKTKINVIIFPKKRELSQAVEQLFSNIVDKINKIELIDIAEANILTKDAFSGKNCTFTKERLVVSWDGKVYPCIRCVDESYELGDVNISSLADVWHSAGRLELLNRQVEDFDKGTEFCHYCSWREIVK